MTKRVLPLNGPFYVYKVASKRKNQRFPRVLDAKTMS